MPREYVDIDAIRAAILDILKAKKTKTGLYKWIDGQRLRERVRTHLNLTTDQVIRSEDWDEAVAIEVEAGNVRRGDYPYPQRLAFVAPKA